MTICTALACLQAGTAIPDVCLTCLIHSKADRRRKWTTSSIIYCLHLEGWIGQSQQQQSHQTNNNNIAREMNKRWREPIHYLLTPYPLTHTHLTCTTFCLNYCGGHWCDKTLFFCIQLIPCIFFDNTSFTYLFHPCLVVGFISFVCVIFTNTHACRRQSHSHTHTYIHTQVSTRVKPPHLYVIRLAKYEWVSGRHQTKKFLLHNSIRCPHVQ